jgi:integrase
LRDRDGLAADDFHVTSGATHSIRNLCPAEVDAVPGRSVVSRGGRLLRRAPLFLGVKSSALRTAIAKACRATGTPLWSPHDLKQRRISLLDAQGKTWAEIADLVGNRSAKVLSDTYTHVLMDERELDYARVIAERLGASSILRRPETMEV